MASISDLIGVVDAYKDASGVCDDTTVSYRVFRDTKKVGALRGQGADITVSRYNLALRWFDANWPEGVAKPQAVQSLFDAASAAADADRRFETKREATTR